MSKDLSVCYVLSIVWHSPGIPIKPWHTYDLPVYHISQSQLHSSLLSPTIEGIQYNVTINGTSFFVIFQHCQCNRSSVATIGNPQCKHISIHYKNSLPVIDADLLARLPGDTTERFIGS